MIVLIPLIAVSPCRSQWPCQSGKNQDSALTLQSTAFLRESLHNHKGGHPQFKSATPQYCGQPNRLRNCGLKKVAELRLRTFKIWLPQFRNSQQFPASSATFCPFSSAQDGLKKSPKIFFECLFLGKPKTCLKGTVARNCWSFFHGSTGFLILYPKLFSYGNDSQKNSGRKSCATVPLKSSES